MEPEDPAGRTPICFETESLKATYPAVPGHEVVSFEDIRTRPGMYVGGTDFSGLSHYLQIAIWLMLAHNPTYIRFNVDDVFEIVSDAEIKLTETEDGFIPFEVMGHLEDSALTKLWGRWRSPNSNSVILTALSRELVVSITTAQQREELHFVRGVRTLYRVVPIENETLGTTLRFQPESDVFTVTQIGPAAFRNYFRRLSYLYAGIQFSFTAEGETQVFQADKGIEDLFAVLATPHRLMHEPIQFACEEGDLKLQLVMGYHNGNDDHLYCFINNDLAVEGGMHEQGLRKALKRLRQRLTLPRWQHC